MVDAIEHFFNWQSDMDWGWGPFLFLRPSKTERMTLRMWLTMLGLGLLFGVPFTIALSGILLYYDYTTAQHHEAKVTPVIVTEAWMTKTSPGAVLFYSAIALAICLLGCIGQHWAWNRRAERLNRKGSAAETVVEVLPGVWPPPPSGFLSGSN